MKDYQEQTDMERLLTKLSVMILDDENENDVHRMFHNAKGSNDAVEAVHELIEYLVDYKKAAEADMKHRESIRTTAISDLNKVIEETK